MNNKKGLSAIVATLLIILLTLVAVGIIWIVIRNVVQSGTEQINIDAMCVSASVEVISVTNSGGNLYDVVVTRKSGDDPIGGVKLVFTGDPGSNSSVVTAKVGNGEALGTNFGVLSSKTINGIDLSDVTNPNKVTASVYFLDASGKEQICNTASMYTFK